MSYQSYPSHKSYSSPVTRRAVFLFAQFAAQDRDGMPAQDHTGRSHTHMHDATAHGYLASHERVLAEPLLPVGTEATMGRSDDRIFVDAVMDGILPKRLLARPGAHLAAIAGGRDPHTLSENLNKVAGRAESRRLGDLR